MESITIGQLLFSGLGLIFMVVGIYFYTHFRRITKNGTRTKAKIIDYKPEVSTDSDGYSTTYYYAVIEFRGKNGDSVVHKLDHASDRKYKSNFIDIFYLFEDEEYKIVTNSALFKHYLPCGFMVIGLFSILIAILKYLEINPLSVYLE